jgi:hypothetical protein
MSARSKEIVALKIRLATSLLAQLEAAARKNQRSANAEAVVRLGKSFTEEIVFGSAEARQIIQLMAAAFLSAGQRAAGKQKDWVHNNPEAYAQGWLAMTMAALLEQPGITVEQCRLQLQSLMGRVETFFINVPRKRGG